MNARYTMRANLKLLFCRVIRPKTKLLYLGLCAFYIFAAICIIFHGDVNQNIEMGVNDIVESQLANFSAIAEHCGVDENIFLGTKEKSYDCLQWLATEHVPPTKMGFETIFHTYIFALDVKHVPGPVYAAILSFLVTQPADSQYWIWTTDLVQSAHGTTNGTYKMPTHPRIKPTKIDDANFFTHLYDQQAGKALFRYVSDKNVTRGWDTVHLSDFVRQAFLNIYGGVWVDVDTILLRPFQPLLHRQFVYRWGTDSQVNDAVMHFNKGGVLTNASLSRSYNAKSRSYNVLALNPYDKQTYNCTNPNRTSDASGEDTSCLILPVVYFDPHWIRFSNGVHMLRNITPVMDPPFLSIMSSKSHCVFPEEDIFSQFYKGAFAFHCHCYKELVQEEGSCMHDMILALRKKLEIND